MAQRIINQRKLALDQIGAAMGQGLGQGIQDVRIQGAQDKGGTPYDVFNRLSRIDPEYAKNYLSTTLKQRQDADQFTQAQIILSEAGVDPKTAAKFKDVASANHFIDVQRSSQIIKEQSTAQEELQQALQQKITAGRTMEALRTRMGFSLDDDLGQDPQNFRQDFLAGTLAPQMQPPTQEKLREIAGRTGQFAPEGASKTFPDAVAGKAPTYKFHNNIQGKQVLMNMGDPTDSMILGPTPKTGGGKAPKTMNFFDRNDPSNVVSVAADENGNFVAPTQSDGQPMLPANEAILKEKDRTSAGTLGNLAVSGPSLDRLDEIYDRKFYSVGDWDFMVNKGVLALGGLLDQDLREAEMSINNIIETKVRIDSGAAIKDEEVKRIAKSFAPRLGDSRELIKRKQKYLRLYIESVNNSLDPNNRWAGWDQDTRGTFIVNHTNQWLAENRQHLKEYPTPTNANTSGGSDAEARKARLKRDFPKLYERQYPKED